MFKDVGRVVVSRPFWIQTSPITVNHRTEDDLKNYYSQCQKIHASYFTSLWGGRLYSCTRQAIFHHLGYDVPDNEYIDLQKDYTPDQLREALKTFYERDYYTSCNYCNNVEDSKNNLIKPGEQHKW